MIKAAHISDSVFGSPAILKAFASLALSTLFFILMYAGGVSPVMSAVLAGLVLVCHIEGFPVGGGGSCALPDMDIQGAPAAVD